MKHNILKKILFGWAKTPNIDIEMVKVEGGTFTMGCTPEQGHCKNEAIPAHQVTVSAFYMSKFPITQKQWVDIMFENPSRYKGDNFPVGNVNWKDVQKFIAKLNVTSGKKYRLPTEAEWEYAARGGNKSKGYKYSGSNELKKVGWDHYITCPVGIYLPNELGLHDMSGNVFEWCGDWYGEYGSRAQSNPTGPSFGLKRVVRNG